MRFQDGGTCSLIVQWGHFLRLAQRDGNDFIECADLQSDEIAWVDLFMKDSLAMGCRDWCRCVPVKAVTDGGLLFALSVKGLGRGKSLGRGSDLFVLASFQAKQHVP